MTPDEAARIRQNQDYHMLLVRNLAKQELGADDPETCFRMATILWMHERLGGHNHTPPHQPVVLDIEGDKPIDDPTVTP